MKPTNKRSNANVPLVSARNALPLYIDGNETLATAPLRRSARSQSQSPVLHCVYPLGDRRTAQLTLGGVARLATDDEAIVEAIGRDGSILFQGQFGEGNEAILDFLGAKPDAPGMVDAGELNFRVRKPTGATRPLGGTSIVLHWLDVSKLPKSLRSRGVPIEILAPTFGAAQKIKLFLGRPVADIVADVFNAVPPRYDIWQGAPHFVTISSWNNITLHYSAYQAAHNSPSSILNCYDAAAVLQYLLRLNGNDTKYCFMSPFGYLRKTDLIGRGICNNPFYGSAGNAPIVPDLAPGRTAFGNHAFVNLVSTGTIADACAGPHTGGETPAQYVDAATDDRFPNPPSVPRGTVADINYYHGVVSVNTIRSIKSLAGAPYVKAVKRLLAFSKSEVLDRSRKATAGTWPDPGGTSQATGTAGWQTAYEEIVPGEDEVLKLLVLRKKEKILRIKLYIGSGPKMNSYNRFLMQASVSQRPEHPFTSGPDDLGHYCLRHEAGPYSTILWVSGNVVAEISGFDCPSETEQLARWYWKWASKHTVDSLTPKLPKFQLARRPTSPDTIEVSAKGSGRYRMEVLDPDGICQSHRHTDAHLALARTVSKKGRVRLACVDTRTLLVKTVPITL